jgi:hypothetical protein
VFSACFAKHKQLAAALREIAKHRDEVPKITVFARVVKNESGSYRRGTSLPVNQQRSPTIISGLASALAERQGRLRVA